MRLLPRAIGSLLLLSASLHADNPYEYRYGSAAYERAVASRRSDERLGAPVTNSGGYTPDFSSTINAIRNTLGTKLTPAQIMANRRREQEEARRSQDDDFPSLQARNNQPVAPAPREPSYAERIQTQARQGNPEAMQIYGQMLLYSSNPATQDSGIQMLTDAFNRGNAMAGKNLIGYYLGHPEKNQFPRVLELMSVLSDRGDEHFTRELAKAYLTGIPERKLAADPAKARLFLERSFTQFGNPESGLELARLYRDSHEPAQAIATCRQLIENQIKRPTKAYHNCGPAAWEWIQLAKETDPTFAHVDAPTVALWEYGVLHSELRSRAASHRVAAELGDCFHTGRGAIARDNSKAILYLSIATSGDYRGTRNHDEDEVVLSNIDQARRLYAVARLLLEASPAWPTIDREHELVPSHPRDIARLYTRACHYAALPDENNAPTSFPSPFIELYQLSFDPGYGLKLTDEDRLVLLDRGLDLGEIPNDPKHPEHRAYAEATYERARLIRALGDQMPDTQHRAALGFQKAWDYGWKPAALPLAELIDDLRLPGKTRADAKAICRIAAENGDAFCAAQLGTWLTGEVVTQAKPDPALVADARRFLQQAIAADILHASEDAGYLNSVTGQERDAVANFNTVIAREPTPRSRAGLAELIAIGRGGSAADPKRALQLLEKAAEEDPFYSVRLAELHRRAQWGLPKNAAHAIELLEAALYRDNEWHAGLELARLYHTGTDVAKDEEKASECLSAAGERGNNETARLIAEAYETGSFINPDPESAAHWRDVAIHGQALDPG